MRENDTNKKYLNGITEEKKQKWYI